MLQTTKSYKKSLLSNRWRGMDFKRSKIITCEPRPHYRVWIRFDDGLEGEVDLSHLVGKGIFSAWEDVEFFNQVKIDPISDTLAWGKDIDLDPYVLREQVAVGKKKTK